MPTDSLTSLFKYLPIRICESIHRLPDGLLSSANEIRLRKNAPLSLTVGNKNIIFDEKGRPCDINSAVRTRDDELAECLMKLTNGSLYTCDEFVSSGFIPLPEGGRAGVCGSANLQNGKMNGFLEISSINLRLHRFLPDVAKPLIEELNKNGLKSTLVCSPPALGKTTFLRSAAYLLSSGQGIEAKRVGIADERCEISVGIVGKGLLEVISSAEKAKAISILTRTMAPELIVCDEISADDVEPLLEAQSSGVTLIASAHCKTPAELKKRGRMSKLLDAELFPLCVILDYDGGYCFKIAETENFL